MNRFRYRQLLLFLIVLGLPTAAIVVQSRRNAAQEQKNAAQERELTAQRRNDARKQRAADIGRDILARLERIKLGEIARTPASALPQTASYSDPAVAFVGWEEGERLVLPWDVRLGNGGSSLAVRPELQQWIQAADRAEFGEQNFARAASLYKEALALSTADGERASLMLPLANALERSGARGEAFRLYHELLNLPSSLTDDQGLSYASYAAVRLSKSSQFEKDVLPRVRRDVEQNLLMSPAQAYRTRDVLQTLRESKDAAIRDGSSNTVTALDGRIADLEQALDVQEKFQTLRITPGAWELYPGRTPWWIGKASTGASSNALILAVRVEDIRRAVAVERSAASTEPSFQISPNDAGEVLHEALPGVRLAFGPELAETTVASPDTGRSFYNLSLFLVVMLTFAGAYFLWQDTRRESRLAQLRSQFVASVSHELKTPLTSIRMFAESLQMDDENGTGDPKERAEYLDTIVCESERLTRLLNNVLDFSRIERGQKNYHLQSEELPGVVEAAVRTMRFPLAEQGFHLHVDVCDDLPPVKVDRDAIEQAILNLLNNAMKYSGKNRDIGLRVSRQNGSALIQVSDRGIGIPASEQRRIFEKFYRVPSKENKAISGTGLGLALVAHIAEAHGGSVEVESVPGQGSTFSIRLPLPGAAPALRPPEDTHATNAASTPLKGVSS